MRFIVGKFTYANVTATIALFLALSGGVVWAANNLGKNVVKSKNIAANAVRTQDIAKNAVKSAKIAAKAVREKNLAVNSVSGAKVKKETLTRTDLKGGTLAGLQIAEVQAASVPGLATEGSAQGTPVPLTGTATFVPAAGKSYLLLGELRGTPSDANSGEPGGCFSFVRVYVNDQPITGMELSANEESEAPFKVISVSSTSTALGMLTPGQPQTVAVNAVGDSGCGSGTNGALRITVVELG